MVVGNSLNNANGDGGGAGQAKGLLGSKYARSKKALMATINEIRATGAAVDVDLPTIVVAGNQSSGKSSLIEAISGMSSLSHGVEKELTGIDQPPSGGRDLYAGPYRVKVRREGSDQDQGDGRKPEVPFGKPIIDSSLVEITIRRAQLGILNPSISLDRFVNYVIPAEPEDKPLGSEKQHFFSNDVIVLEITGPELTDLTLVDLPGIIQNVGQDEDPKNILLIENMVKSYIGKDCLILLVITMKDDIQNQKAALLAREADPDGKRTIGVLTKVDTLQGRTETEQWLKVVQNQREKLTHGYYVTKQPDADALTAGISFEKAREQEDQFFKENTPWKGLDKQLKKRLGTKHLAAFLSDQLSFFIKMRLPELEKQIGLRHREIDQELQKLGKEPSDDPTGALLSLLTNFTNFEAAIDKHVNGAPDYEKFMQEFNGLGEWFKKEVKETEPKFVNIVRSKAEGDDSKVSGKEALDMAMADPDAKMYKDDMRLHIQGCRTRELPTQLPPSALHKLVKRSISRWDEIALSLLEEVKPVLRTLLDDLIQEIFGKYTYGGLAGSVNTIVNDQLNVLLHNAQVLIYKQVAMERRPFTLNTHYLDANRTKSLAGHKDLKRKRVDEPEDSGERKKHVNAVLSGLAAIGQPGIREEDLARLQPVDEYEVELQLMAETEGYWKVAYKRIVDNIPRAIDLEYLAPLAEEIRSALISELKVFGDDAQAKCNEYLDEAPDVAEHRKDLTIRKARLGDAKVAIRKFKMK